MPGPDRARCCRARSLTGVTPPCRERDQVNSSAPRLHVIDVVIQGESCQRVEQLFDALRGTSLKELRVTTNSGERSTHVVKQQLAHAVRCSRTQARNCST